MYLINSSHYSSESASVKKQNKKRPHTSDKFTDVITPLTDGAFCKNKYMRNDTSYYSVDSASFTLINWSLNYKLMYVLASETCQRIINGRVENDFSWQLERDKSNFLSNRWAQRPLRKPLATAYVVSSHRWPVIYSLDVSDLANRIFGEDHFRSDVLICMRGKIVKKRAVLITARSDCFQDFGHKQVCEWLP